MGCFCRGGPNCCILVAQHARDAELIEQARGALGPFKCPDCGLWWAGFAHRCAPLVTQTDTNTTTTTVRCTCPPNRGDHFLGHCPIHDVQVTYTT